MRSRRREMSSGYEKVTAQIREAAVNEAVYYSLPFVYGNHIRQQKVCIDEVHGKRHGRYYDGPLSLVSINNSYSLGNTAYGSYGTDTYRKTFHDIRKGGFYVYPYYTSQLSRNDSEVASFGPQAYSKFSPTAPKVSMGQFLYELREMNPKSVMRDLMNFRRLYDSFRLPTKKLRDMSKTDKAFKGMPKSVSDLYLSYQFGWKPFVQDLLKWYESLRDVDKRIAHLRNNNNRWSKSGGTLFKSTNNSVVSSIRGSYPIDATYTRRVASTSIVTTEHCWFEGRFRYYIPELNDPKWGRLKSIQKLYGLEVTPYLVWQVIPWTWLIGWFTNVGSLINNLSMQINDNLVSNGAWIMHHTTECATSSLEQTYPHREYRGGYLYRTTYKTVNSSAVSQRERKTRVAASPFGFNVDFPDLTPWRLSILTALGLSKIKLPIALI